MSGVLLLVLVALVSSSHHYIYLDRKRPKRRPKRRNRAKIRPLFDVQAVLLLGCEVPNCCVVTKLKAVAGIAIIVLRPNYKNAHGYLKEDGPRLT